MTAHSSLGASSAHRWMRCPGSVRLNEQTKNDSDGSIYAAEGTKAHDLAELCLTHNMDAVDLPDYAEWQQYPRDMREYVQQYIDQVRALHQEIGGELLIEQRMDYSEWVPGGFGTADAVIIGDDQLVVIDLKYGVGVRVDAPGNPQARLYALGAYAQHELGHDFKRVTAVIIQPRVDHYSSEEMTIEDLLAFAEDARIAAHDALKPDAPCVPGEKQCRFCNAKPICRARAEENLRIAHDEFAEPTPAPDVLSLDEIGGLLPRLADIERWAKDVREYALQQAVNGVRLQGYKVVQGRSVRKWIDSAADQLKEHEQADKLLTFKPVGIGKAEKVLGKRHQLIETLTEKGEGKPTLVPESDKRPEMQGTQAAQADFAD